TQHHAVAIINTNHVLAHPPAGQKELTYGRGQYTFPFQFQLPTNFPPSLNPHVRYYVQMYVDKVWYKANTQENKVEMSGNKHVMLSYQWDSQAIVSEIYRHLRTHNIPVWMDIQGGMKGHLS
ncbi:unnamed protein product, partial [Adineta steineri]